MKNLFPKLCFILLALVYFAPHLYSQPISWQPTNGPYAGYVQSMLQHPDGLLLVCTKSNGVWRSNDDGKTWKRLTNGISALHSFESDIVLGPQKELYLVRRCEVYRSDDLGDSWIDLRFDLSDVECALDVAVVSSGQIFVSTQKAIYLRSPNSSFWKKIFEVPDGHFFIPCLQMAKITYLPA